MILRLTLVKMVTPIELNTNTPVKPPNGQIVVEMLLSTRKDFFAEKGMVEGHSTLKRSSYSNAGWEEIDILHIEADRKRCVVM